MAYVTDHYIVTDSHRPSNRKYPIYQKDNELIQWKVIHNSSYISQQGVKNGTLKPLFTERLHTSLHSTGRYFIV